jgi:hypothetical protein
MTFMLGDLDGRITLGGLLGEGGMGSVYRAWDGALERPVAVKFVRSGDPREVERLLLEARFQARVEHPHVVRIHEVGRLEGRACIVMQLVEGGSLAHLAGDLTVDEKVELVRQAALGLHAAHREGLVHRDVKPGNILVALGEDGARSALMSDFGLARDTEAGLTQSGLPAGTLDYMAPEVITGAPSDVRADVYALGATLYAVLSGRPPFRNTASERGIADSEMETPQDPGNPWLRRVLEDEPPALQSLVPGITKDLSVIIAKAMQKESQDRYASAEALAEDLQRLLLGEEIRARSLGWMERGMRWARRHPAPARALGVGLAAILLAGGIVAWSSRRSSLVALEAAQMGAEAKSLELRLSMAYLAAPHDLRPVLADLKTSLERLRSRNGYAAAASLYAQGRVLFLLDQLDAASGVLEASERKGFRGPDMDEALALVYCKLYERERPAVDSLKDAELRTQRLGELDRRYKTPALQRLQSAGRSALSEARRALLERRFEDARRCAQEARQRDPEAFAASLLEIETWLRESHEAFNRDALPQVERCSDQGLALAKSLSQELRSNPEVHLYAAQFHDFKARLLVRKGQSPDAPAQAALQEVDAALALHPELALAWVIRGQVLETQGHNDANAADPKSLARVLAQVDACRKALSLAPEWPMAKQQLALALYTLGHQKIDLGEDPGPALLEGRKLGLEVDRIQPWQASGLHYAFICALDHARALQDAGKDASEPLNAAQAMAKEFQNKKGFPAQAMRSTLADLNSLLARSAWARCEDPQPLQREAFLQYEALHREEPDRFSHVSNMGWSAVEWMQSSVNLGRDGDEILRRMTPVLDQAEVKWPELPWPKIARAQLMVLQLQSTQASHPQLDRKALEAAKRATAAAYKAYPHPECLEFQGWVSLVEAEYGSTAAAARALHQFETVMKGMPGNVAPKVGQIRALCMQGSPSSHAKALQILERIGATASADPEFKLLKVYVLRAVGRKEEADRLAQEAVREHPIHAHHPLLRETRRSSRAV